MTALKLIELLAELFTWIGFLAGGACLLTLVIVRAARGSWVETDAVLVDAPGSGGTLVRWMTDEGTLHTAELTPDELADIKDPDALQIHYSRRSPDRMRIGSHTDGEKVLRVTGLVLVGLGVIAVIVSIITLFIPS
ncbi:hypothetical protein [Glaciihabitans sp. dw_435]|uniref:hypothetical protein n=1 Tax=Glaciihabitans sp. dw_435 TaxID=2720081 RepID=UPI001BD5D41D|nr:hypothetical protein [Glaciihabitans sp. dw_435]